MRYELSSLPGKLRPKAALVLAKLKPEALFFGGRGQRHPLGVFNLTFSEIVRAMRSVLDELDAARNSADYAAPKNYNWHQKLLTATDHLLDSIIQLLDSYGIIIEVTGIKLQKSSMRLSTITESWRRSTFTMWAFSCPAILSKEFVRMARLGPTH